MPKFLQIPIQKYETTSGKKLGQRPITHNVGVEVHWTQYPSLRPISRSHDS